MKKKKISKIDSQLNNTEMINFYELPTVQEFKQNYINPYYDIHKISVPFRGLLIGSSGSGKTNCLLNIIKIMADTFNHIYIYTKMEEQLYTYLQKSIPKDLLTISYDLKDCEEHMNKDVYYGQSLVIFDDMVNEKNQKAINEMFTRGRKIAGSISLLYLTQSYYKVPKTTRLQCQYIFIVKVSGKRDLKMILSEYSLSGTQEQLINMYNHCCNTGKFGNVFLIDLNTTQDRTYRKNFDEILDINNF